MSGYIVIRGARVLNAGMQTATTGGLAATMRGAPHADILIKDDTIAEVGPPGLAAPAEASVIDACIRSLRARGHAVIEIDSFHMPPERAADIVGHRPRGIIASQYVMANAAWQDAIRRWRASGVPIVVHGNEEGSRGFDRISSDHADGAYHLTKRLILEGRRRILQVWFGHDRPFWLREREETPGSHNVLPPASRGLLRRA